MPMHAYCASITRARVCQLHVWQEISKIMHILMANVCGKGSLDLYHIYAHINRIVIPKFQSKSRDTACVT